MAYLHRTDLAGSGLVDILTRPAPALARAALLLQRERRVELNVSDTWKCRSFSFILTHPPADIKKKGRKKKGKKKSTWYLVQSTWHTALTAALDSFPFSGF